jgi:hypothetical protein
MTPCAALKSDVHLRAGFDGVPPPAAEPRLGRRTARSLPLLPPPQKN